MLCEKEWIVKWIMLACLLISQIVGNTYILSHNLCNPHRGMFIATLIGFAILLVLIFCCSILCLNVLFSLFFQETLAEYIVAAGLLVLCIVQAAIVHNSYLSCTANIDYWTIANIPVGVFYFLLVYTQLLRQCFASLKRSTTNDDVSV